MRFSSSRTRSVVAAILLAAIHPPALATNPAPTVPPKTDPIETQRPHSVSGGPDLPKERSRFNPQYASLLDDAVSALKHRILNSPPFMMEERLAHFERLEKVLKNPAVEIAEKYRQILDAYRIELDYSKSVRAYRGLLTIDREERLVDFLGIGRLALYYQTMNGTESGIWRADQQRWQRLSNEDNEDIAQALRTARKIDPPQLIVLPLFGPASTSAQGRPAKTRSVRLPSSSLRKVSLDFPPSSEFQEALQAVLLENMENLKPYFQQQIAVIDEGINKTLVDQLADSNHKPTLEELSQLFVSLQNLIDAQGRISIFPAQVYAPNGHQSKKQVLSLGGFSLISDGRYLSYSQEADKLVELPRQPASSLRSLAQNFVRADANTLASVAIDPSAGETLQLLVQIPNFRERLDQGGVIGYLILVMGGLAYVLCGYRLLELAVIGKRMRNQLASDQLRPDNPLGRVLQRLDQSKSDEREVLYLTVEETIMTEQSQLERHLTLLKLVAAIAPMLGLLGTVTGMIKTFQLIALYGSGDPKLMSGGISEALVTTVEGLVIAIPLLLLHTLLATKSRNLGTLLEAHASYALSQRLERTVEYSPHMDATLTDRIPQAGDRHE